MNKEMDANIVGKMQEDINRLNEELAVAQLGKGHWKQSFEEFANQDAFAMECIEKNKTIMKLLAAVAKYKALIDECCSAFGTISSKATSDEIEDIARYFQGVTFAYAHYSSFNGEQFLNEFINKESEKKLSPLRGEVATLRDLLCSAPSKRKKALETIKQTGKTPKSFAAEEERRRCLEIIRKEAGKYDCSIYRAADAIDLQD